MGSIDAVIDTVARLRSDFYQSEKEADQFPHLAHPTELHGMNSAHVLWQRFGGKVQKQV